MTRQQNRQGLIITGLLLGIFAAAIDNTIVATAMGTIVANLGGLEKFVWVTSAYLVAEMAVMPIFGKLSDMYGRKRFFILGISLFLLGSILCGTAQNIVELSIYRAIQGIGGGALMPIAFTIMFDVVPLEKRGSMSGFFGAVFGASSLIGPLLGAYLTDYLDWRWIFYINVPIGLIALALILLSYHESAEHVRQRIDWWGAATLVGSIVCLMFALELGGQSYAWNSSVIIGLFTAAAVFLAVFLAVETKASEPIVSYAMFRERLFAASTVTSLFYGAGFIIFTMFIPLYVQGVTGGTATNSGLILLPLTLSSVAASQIGGFLATKTSYRNIMLFSALVFGIGTFLLSTLTPDTPRWLLTVFMIIAGFGAGFSFSVLGMASIHSFDMRQRGSANSTLAFVRSLGMTVGLTVFGIIQRNALAGKIGGAFGGLNGESFGDVRGLLTPEGRASVSKEMMDTIVGFLSSSIASMYLWALVLPVLAFAAILFMGNARMVIPGKEPTGEPPTAVAEAGSQ